MLRNQLRIIRDLLRYQLIIRNNRVKLFNQTPCIIASNCNGGIIYHDLGLKFLSPTINLFFFPTIIKKVNIIEIIEITLP